MPTSVELRQERGRVVESLRAITERAEAENRNLDAQEREQYDRHEREFVDLTERIERAETLEQREADRFRPLHDDDGPDRGNDGTRQERAAAERRAAFFRALRVGPNRMPPEERALVENTAGEILVPEDLETEILRSLPELTVMRGLVSVRPTSSNRIRRRSLGEVAVAWGKLETGGGAALTDSMPSTPTEEWTYIEDQIGLAKVGEDELDDTDVNIEAFVRDSFSRALAESEDTAAAIGAGHASLQPVGIMTTGGGIATVTASAITATDALLDDYLKLAFAVPAQYRRNGRYLFSSTTELAVSLLKDSNNNYKWKESARAGQPNTLHGYPISNQEDIASIGANARSALFGDLNATYRLYDRQGMALVRLAELYAEEGMVGFKVKRRVGGDVIRPEASRILVHPAS